MIKNHQLAFTQTNKKYLCLRCGGSLCAYKGKADLICLQCKRKYYVHKQ